jgi:hypothetical protein
MFNLVKWQLAFKSSVSSYSKIQHEVNDDEGQAS